MNATYIPRAFALSISTAVFLLQLVAFGSGTEGAMPEQCNDMAVPSAITVPPVLPEAPGSVPAPSENQSVSI